ncbi:REP-associated tyrosine transposase [sulfur-oxidizing endosymbiont of Gigantopelta aegis]|uniref:REP-associated tyrosine transposase n=1 Tax=sulfur-oxidizing endosymbiont of Gigantopelta aegis TaxID=2794934 RepID=UPI0018DCAEFD|nr:transposase [sulfur-oxidizing endosymbiont of Gigantopelta aegis]
MTNYRRAKIEGASYFFTVNLEQRSQNNLLIEHIESLRNAFHQVRNKHPFTIDAIVILPEHLHCIWTLPEGDADFKTRWGLIKANFSRQIPSGEKCSQSRIKRGERGIWQRRYWEHLLRDEVDFQHHVDYIHWNPVKHGWVTEVKQWPYSSFHQYVKKRIVPENWASDSNIIISAGE